MQTPTSENSSQPKQQQTSLPAQHAMQTMLEAASDGACSETAQQQAQQPSAQEQEQLQAVRQVQSTASS